MLISKTLCFLGTLIGRLSLHSRLGRNWLKYLHNYLWALILVPHFHFSNLRNIMIWVIKPLEYMVQ